MAENLTLNTIIVLRNDSTTNWENSSYKLEKGEVGIEFTESGKTRVKIGVGGKAWSELPYFGGEEAHIYRATVAKGADHIAAITEVVADAELNTHDVAIVEEALLAADLVSETVAQKYQHTAYRWNGTSWAAFDGNYNAKNVIFDEDFTFTKEIGTVTIPDSGSTKVAAAGKSIKDFFAGVFAAEENPTRSSNASVSWASKGEPTGTVEVGTNITPTYNATFNAGGYSYGPDTGLTATSWTVSIADTGDDAQTTNSGSFATFQAIDGMSKYAKVTAKATHGDGAIPVTNIGNAYDADGSKSVRIMAGEKSVTSGGYTSYRAWFHGYKAGGATVDVGALDSNAIRGLTANNGKFTSSMTTNKMQQMFFAAPKGVVKSVGVANATNGAPQTVKSTTVYVKGKNDYVTNDAPNGMEYDLFYVSNDNADSGAATYNITVTK